jgi:hypothetical protein
VYPWFSLSEAVRRYHAIHFAATVFPENGVFGNYRSNQSEFAEEQDISDITQVGVV